MPTQCHTVTAAWFPAPEGTAGSLADTNGLEGITWVMKSGANTQNKFPEGYRNTHSSNASPPQGTTYSEFSMPNTKLL